MYVTYQLQRKKTKQDKKKIGEIGKEDIDPELMCNKSIPQVPYKKNKKNKKNLYLKLWKEHKQPVCHILKQLQTNGHQIGKEYHNSRQCIQQNIKDGINGEST